MQLPENTVQAPEATPVAPTSRVITEPDFSGTALPIGSMTERADWPQCALGALVDIHGFEGVVVEIINQSLKVRSSERITQRFNAYRLKVLFAPPDRSQSVPSIQAPRAVPPAAAVPVEETPAPAAPVRVHITAPDFSAPIRAIRTYASQPDFPQCAYGKHVDIPGYAGVVVEIVKGSLKVQSEEGTIRSFNASALRKLYGKA
jgi:hypothetical protein